MPKSEKPPVIDRIYDTLLDPESQELARTVVTYDDVKQALEWARATHGLKLKGSNPFNFMKDIIRGEGGAGMWPERLKAKRITARQVTGDSNIFEFANYEDDQTEPFPSKFKYREGVETIRVQSVSIPLATKALGRNDETYLIQVAVKLGIIETHLALKSKHRVIEVTHLQVGIKLRLAEVDSMYAALYENGDGGRASCLVTVEAKKRGQRILEEQVIQQVRGAFTATDTSLVIPMAMVVAETGIYVAEFNAVAREELELFKELTLATEALYELTPAVVGINARKKAKKAKKAKKVESSVSG